ncbi:MAG TPA: hypothetical protein ENH26_00660 [Candidatus Wolfebacteria bacterium]|nr:hypothetical protein [Candidatus Wolfebacteria bacterium]
MNISLGKVASKIGLIIILIILISPVLLTTKAATTPGEIPTAQDIGLPASPIQDVDELVGTIANIVTYVYIIFFVITILFIILAAFNYLTAGGDTEKIKNAHKQLIYASIAIVIALISIGAITIIENFLKTGN